MAWDRGTLARMERQNFIDRWEDNKSYQYFLPKLRALALWILP